MSIFCGLFTNNSAVHQKLVFHLHKHDKNKPKFIVGVQFPSSSILITGPNKTQSLSVKCFAASRNIIMSAGRDNYPSLVSDYDSKEDSFLLTLIKDAFRALKSLYIFLLEQPSQLKFIEWPSFQSTVRTAALTLVLVVIFIIALSSVDSALWYILALLLRKAA